MAERTDEFMPRDEMGTPGEEDTGLADADPVEIRAEIRETRERMGDTLEQLGERLNPGRLKEQVKQDVRDATIGKVKDMAQSAADQMGEARHTITDTIRENPIPAAMVGVGLGWLIYNATQQGSPGSLRSMRRGERARVGRYGDAYSETGYGTGYAGSMSERGGTAGEPGAIDRARERASEVAGSVQDTASELAERAQGMAETVTDRTRYQAHRLEDQFYENPLAVGAAALALGMTAGLAIPETHKESELMGGARDRLAHKMRDVAEETKDKVERVVDQAQSTAKRAAQEEGLTSS